MITKNGLVKNKTAICIDESKKPELSFVYTPFSEFFLCVSIISCMILVEFILYIIFSFKVSLFCLRTLKMQITNTSFSWTDGQSNSSFWLRPDGPSTSRGESLYSKFSEAN